MIKRVLPGHFRAFTIWVCVVLGFITYWITKEPISVLGLELVILGLFLGDQTTHLAQADHSAPPETEIEKLMQNYRITFMIVSSIVILLGIYLLL